MVVANSKEIRTILKTNCPNLNNNSIWLTDKEFILPTIEEIKIAVKVNSVKDLPYIKNMNECEDYSFEIVARKVDI